MAKFEARTGTANPFNGVDVGSGSTPTLVDIDKDGDLDAFLGESNGNIRYFKNTGNSSNPKFIAVTGTGNPLNGVNVGLYSAPTLVDIDGDGDFDALIGEFYGSIKYFRNTGNSSNPKFIAVTGTGNPFDGQDVGYNSTPTLVDIDGDGDFDAFIGEIYGEIKYYKNTGSSNNPQFIEVTGTGNPFDGEGVGSYSKIILANIDGDGDFDAFVGGGDGKIKYFKNTGSSSNPQLIAVTGAENPFNGVDVGNNSAPTLVDINQDGDLDAFIGASDGTIKYFENVPQTTTTNIAPSFVKFTAVAGTGNPLNKRDVGNFSTPNLVDIDKDGDLDALIGASDGTIKYFRNTGNSSNPKFIPVTGTGNPFNGQDVGNYSTPNLVDIDKDGDLDALIGEFFGNIKYFRNTGNSSNPQFIEVTGTGNPFDGVDVGNHSAPSLADIDKDGDLDAFIGAIDGTIKYFRNTGNSSNPKFIAVTGTGNPFNSVDVGNFSKLILVDLDIDADGDLDALIGAVDGTIKYFQNTGNSSNPQFVEGGNIFDVGNHGAPTLADLDADGDLDALIGERLGTIKYLKNNSENLIYNLDLISENDTASVITGNTVAEIITNNTIADLDGIVEAVAVTAVDNSNGNWQYSTNGGSSWTDFGTVTETSARLLDSTHKVRFIPNANWYGKANITLRLWDKTTGVAGGTANVTSNGGATAFSGELTKTVITVNADPDNLNISPNNLDENKPIGTVVGNFTTTDPDTGDTHTYSLVAGTGSTDNGLFEIVGNQLKTKASFDFETKNSYSIRVQTDDGRGGTFQKVLTIGVNDLNTTPTNINLSASSVNENRVSGTVVGNLTTTDVEDPKDPHTYSLVDNANYPDNTFFQIDNVNKQLKTATSFNFEAKNSYTIKVQTNDGKGGIFEKVLTIGVNDINDVPTNINISNNSVNENQAIGTVVGNLTSTDEDAGDTHTYSLVAGTGSTDNGSFEIVGNQLRTKASFNFEAKNSYSIRVQTNDGNGGTF
ncbi:MAG: VCBS repeat-containing protein, partial [Gomphosphaeria aponina SAG 52.96 = DSM 107014]|nr:VCBS repeat-containing protein [Gomphosphaeria aponina SAG 52.96 = DSM 107014]